jgi:hypothetical protein
MVFPFPFLLYDVGSLSNPLSFSLREESEGV